MAELRFTTAAVALLSLVVPGQSVTYPSVSTDCTDAASKSVSWDIHNFTFDSNSRFYYGPGTAGRVSFSIKNSANGYAFDCLQGTKDATGRASNHFQKEGKVWYGCNVYCYGAQGLPLEPNPPLDTSFFFDTASKSLSVSQVWNCGKGDALTNYTATGSVAVPNVTCQQVKDGRPDQVACSPFDVTVKATTVSTGVVPKPEEALEDDPYLGVGPGGDDGNPFAPPPTAEPLVKHNTPSCNKRSQNTTWTVSSLRTSAIGGVRFSLTNNALNYTQRCAFSDITSDFEARIQAKNWWNCTRFDPNHVNYPSAGVYTTILYGGSDGVFGVNQSWYCDDEDVTSPTVHSVYAETKLLIKCNEKRYCQPPGRYDTDPTLVVQDSCRVDDLTLSPVQAQTQRVTPAQAVDTFRAHGYNCSIRSLGELGPPVWEVSGFSFNRTWVAGAAAGEPGAFQDEAHFNFKSVPTDTDWPASRVDRGCGAQSSPGDGDKAFDGVADLDCSNFQNRDRAFRFDFESKVLTLIQGWSCDGVDRNHTNSFSAVGSLKLPLSCSAVGTNGTRCATTTTLAVPMSNMTKNLNFEVNANAGFPFGSG